MLFCWLWWAFRASQMTNEWANWGIRQEIDFRQGNSNDIARSVNWRSRIQVIVQRQTDVLAVLKIKNLHTTPN